MTLEEAAFELHLAPKTLYYNFKRTQENFAKKGVYITREGRAQKLSYNITYDTLIEFQDKQFEKEFEDTYIDIDEEIEEDVWIEPEEFSGEDCDSNPNLKQ